MYHANIYELVTNEENAYQALPVQVADNWEWNMFKHIATTILYKNGQLMTGKTDDKPVKNITLPILRLQYRAEGFDVKDIQLFVNDAKNYYKSFLIKKFHEKWARDNNIDTFIDKLVESYVDFGGALVKDVNEIRPEVVPLQRIAFCDQTDILSGTIAEKHFYSPDQLKEMEAKGWKNIDEVIILSENYKKEVQTQGKQTKTPGKYIEVYEVHGMFPAHWLDEADEAYAPDAKENDYIRQLHIITYYKDKDDKKQGICLYKGKEKELPYKLVLRDEIYGRALGLGGGEELFEPQVWTTYNMIHIKNMLDAAAKVVFQTSDEAFANRNKIKDMENLEIMVVDQSARIEQINTFPVNLKLFEESTTKWEEQARITGAANESIMGESPTAGTPFKLQELVTAESHSLHEYRKGKLATFLGEIYRDWIIPHISREIVKGQEWLGELDLDELQSVADSLVTNEAFRMETELVLNGESVDPKKTEEFKQKVRDGFMKVGNKHFFEIFKEEMKDAPVDVSVNIVGKQKNLSGYVDKLGNVFRQLLSTYDSNTGTTILDRDPRMAKTFNEILEASGLSPIDFSQQPKEQLLIQPQAVGAGIQQNQLQPVAQ